MAAARWEEKIQEPGKPQRRLMEVVKENMQRVEVTEVDAGDIVRRWRQMIRKGSS